MLGMTRDDWPIFRTLTGIYEPSAIQQLPDGRFLVAEDEKERPFSLLSIGADGAIDCKPLLHAQIDSEIVFRKLDDLEGLTLAQSGEIYAITSHSRDGDGDAKKSRERLVRFRIDGDRVVAHARVEGLKPALIAAHPVLAAAAAITDVKGDGGLNIEALEITSDQQRLLIGFRSPLLDHHAIIASVENPAAMFDAGEPPRISARLETLSLRGDGLRGLSYLPALGGYLLISGPVGGGAGQFCLWFWGGQPGETPRRVSVPGLPDFAHAEGISPAIFDGRQFVIVVSDDGSRKEQRFARYLLLAAERIQIAA
jgi:hypothetical protein